MEYGLEISDSFPHEDVSRKTDGEGGTVYNAIIKSVYQDYTEQNANKNTDNNQSGNT